LSTGAFLLLSAASWWLLYAGEVSLVAFAAGIVLFDLGIQGAHISNQSEVYRLRPDARSRLTTCYMSCYFSGGAVGSGLSAVLFSAYGWSGTCVLGSAMGVMALVVWGATELRLPFARMQRREA
ncbi:MAG: MFS transporter, partial [Pseudomonadota bacterium]